MYIYICFVDYYCLCGRFVVNEINARDDILPNITLGLVGLDDCQRDISQLAQILHLIPITDDDGTITWPDSDKSNSSINGTIRQMVEICTHDEAQCRGYWLSFKNSSC